jgi:small subunit ribosomal protein S8
MYPIADMLNRIRNAQAVQKETVEVPFSNMNLEIAKILEKNDFVGKAEKKGKKMKKIIEIDLKYDGKTPAVSGLKIISRPGQRIYVQSKNIKIVRGGYGISIVSTSKGLMTNKEARKQKVGGELICEIW